MVAPFSARKGAVLFLIACLLFVLIREDYPQRLWRFVLQQPTPVTLSEHYRTMTRVHAGRMEQSRETPLQLAFAGDSIIEMWMTPLSFPNSVNLGIGRDTLAGLSARIQPGMIAQARIWYLGIGINDVLRQRSPAQMQTDITRLSAQFKGAELLIWRAALPVARPDWSPRHETLRQAYNDMARRACQALPRCHFLPAPPLYAQQIRVWTTDGLHPNAEGYGALSRQLQSLLQQLQNT